MSTIAWAIGVFVGAAGAFFGFVLPRLPTMLRMYASGLLISACMVAERRMQGGANLVLVLVTAAPFAAVYAWLLL